MRCAGIRRREPRTPDVDYDAEFMPPAEADAMLAWLSAPGNVAWAQETFRIFGRTQPVPRLTAWCGDAGVTYRYTGLEHECSGWPAPLEAALARVRARAGVCFNFVLLNRYDDGSKHMGWHRDNEPGCQPTVASLSLGARRRFHVEQCHQTHRVDLDHGSLVVFNAFERHRLSPTKRAVGRRVNLTFRLIERNAA